MGYWVVARYRARERALSKMGLLKPPTIRARLFVKNYPKASGTMYARAAMLRS